MRGIIASLLVLFGVQFVCSLDNGLGQTPQMGFNTWNHFACDISEDVIIAAAQTMKDLGFLEAGYTYVNLDDCWQAAQRNNVTGAIEADPVKFPKGMANLVNYVHSLGFKFGLYSDAGSNTCGGRPGSLGYEKLDAQTYASWGVDYLKYDNCNNENIIPEERYPIMRDALNATGRPIFYSMCEWGMDFPGKWAPEVGNSWRTTIDIYNNWLSVVTRIKQNDLSAPYAAQGGWNDPDMLEVGNGVLTDVEDRSHFSLWALAKAPLILGCDLTAISNYTKSLFLNDEVIAVNQDSLGKQGRFITGQYPPNYVVPDGDAYLTMSPCNGKPEQQWVVFNGTLVEQSHNRCITSPYCYGWSDLAVVSACGGDNACGQQWKLQPNGANVQIVFSLGPALEVFEGVGPMLQVFGPLNDDTEMFYYNTTSKALQWVNSNLCLSADADAPLEVWAGPLADGSVAVVLFNRWENEANITAAWSDIGLKSGQATVRDLWAKQDIGTFSDTFTALVEPHGVQMIKITPSN